MLSKSFLGMEVKYIFKAFKNVVPQRNIVVFSFSEVQYNSSRFNLVDMDWALFYNLL